jgi:cytochrome c oxidase subunit 2
VTVIPVVILVGIAIPSFRLLYYLDKTADTDMVIKVTGNQWYWNYEYPDEGFAFDSYLVDEEDLQEGQIRRCRSIIRWLFRRIPASSC